MPDVPGVVSAEELERLPHAELAALLAEAYRLIGEQAALIGRLQARVEEVERRAGKDSQNSSRPPSSDSPYKKKPRDRSLRERGKRRPGKQPGAPGTTMKLADDPDERIELSPVCCGGCGAGLAAEPVLDQRRHQVTDIVPPPPPKVTEYVAQSKACPCCGTVSEGVLPAHVGARASYGPQAHAQAAYLACGHHVPVGRVAVLMCQLAGIAVSTGWVAGIRGKAAALIGASGFGDRMRDLLRQAPALHVDETPARAAGGLRYVHLACTRYLTLMHTGDRSGDAIDAGQVLPGYTGIIVRDGYHGYTHLTDALHAWCAAHLLRDLKGLHDAEPGAQEWAAKMACLLLHARDTAAAARRAGQAALDPAILDDLVTRYRAVTADGLWQNLTRHTATARDARAIARRFQRYEDMILRFTTRPDLHIFTNNASEQAIKGPKRHQAVSGYWHSLATLACYCRVRSYLVTSRNHGIRPIDAIHAALTGRPWLPAPVST